MADAIHLGPFELEQPIGRGGAAEVWRGFHREQGLPVAVKVVVPSPDHTADPHAQFGDEVRAVASLNHTGIITVFDYGQIDTKTAMQSEGRLTPGMPYLVMELVSGGSLLDTEPVSTFAQLRSKLLELLDALAHAHARGVIHRDIKAGNVLVTEGDRRLKLTDFGIAHALRARATSEIDPRATGTPHYMAPEQIRGEIREQGPWTDLYGVGCLVYRLVTGHPPFSAFADDLTSLISHQLFNDAPPLQGRFEIPLAFHEWLARLMEKAPQDRYRFAADAAFDLINIDPNRTVHSPASRAQEKWTAETAKFVRHALPGWASDPDATLVGTVDPFAPSPAKVPPPPVSWRRPGTPAPWAQLRGGGLGLHGLRRVPLVGRERARDTIWAALREVHETHETRALLLHGPAGIGKSRLAQWACERAHEVGGATVVKATHGPFPGMLVGLPRMVAEHFRCVGLAREEIVDRLATKLRDEGVYSEYELLSLVEFIAPTRAHEGQATVRFRSSKDRHAFIARFLQRLSRSRPVIVWLEDVQWAHETLEFVKDLLSTRDARVLIILTARIERSAEWQREAALLDELKCYRSVTELEIGPLAPKELGELVRATLGLSETLVSAIVERCQGNPLFAAQLVDDWVERQWLDVGPDGFRLKDGVVPILPDDLHHVWQYRLTRLLDGLPTSSLIPLELGAILGPEIDDWEWQQVCKRIDMAFPDEILERLLDQHLMHSSEPGWTFVHQMLRESLERRAQEHGRAAKHHRACAETLSEIYFFDQPGVAERVGRHWVEAGDYEAALTPLLRAVDTHQRRSGFVAAKLLLDLREVALERASIPKDAHAWAEQLSYRARSFELLGELEQADRFAAATIACAEANGYDDLMPRAVRILGDVRRQKGDLESAAALLDRAIELSETSGDVETLASSFLPAADMARRAGDLTRAGQLIDRGERAAARSDNPVATVNFITLRALIAVQRGDHADARQLFSAAAGRYEAVGSTLGVANCTKGRGDVERHAHRYEAARELYLEAHAQYRAINAGDAVLRLDLLLLDIAEGAMAQAEAGLNVLIDDLESDGSGGFANLVRVALLPCLAGRRAWADFDQVLRSTVDLLASGRVLEPDVAISLELASQIAYGHGEVSRGRHLASLAAEQWRRLGQVARAEALESP